MTTEFENLIARLRDTPPDRDLGGLERDVLQRIRGGRTAMAASGFVGTGRAPAAAQTSLGAIVLMAALLFGAAVATFAQIERSELSVFSHRAPMAPSTLLSEP